MAWLDDSPELFKELNRKDFTKQQGAVNLKWLNKWNLLRQIPLLNIIFSYYRSRSSHKKLNDLETIIKNSSFENFQGVLAIWKKLFLASSLAKSNPKVPQLHQDLMERVKQLKKLVIQKSKKMLDQLEEYTPEPATPAFINSHQQINQMFNLKIKASAPKDDSYQNKVYWRYTPTEVHPVVREPRLSSPYYLFTTFNMLMNLLRNVAPRSLNSQHLAEIKLSHSQLEWQDSPSPFVCGVSFNKTSPLFYKLEDPKNQFTFWQPKQTEKALSEFILPVIIKDRRLTKHVQSLFFKTDEDFSSFREWVSNQDAELNEILSGLEEQQQIIIHTPSPGQKLFN